jgi:DNA replication protein DnaD
MTLSQLFYCLSFHDHKEERPLFFSTIDINNTNNKTLRASASTVVSLLHQNTFHLATATRRLLLASPLTSHHFMHHKHTKITHILRCRSLPNKQINNKRQHNKLDEVWCRNQTHQQPAALQRHWLLSALPANCFAVQGWPPKHDPSPTSV